MTEEIEKAIAAFAAAARAAVLKDVGAANHPGRMEFRAAEEADAAAAAARIALKTAVDAALRNQRTAIERAIGEELVEACQATNAAREELAKVQAKLAKVRIGTGCEPYLSGWAHWRTGRGDGRYAIALGGAYLAGFTAAGQAEARRERLDDDAALATWLRTVTP